MTTARTIAKNTIVLIAAQAINIVITLIYLAYTTRYLQAEGFGILSFALAFTSMFVFISDPGLSTLMTREVSKDKSLGSKYLGTIGVIRIGLSFLTFVLIAIIINLYGYPQQTIQVVYIIALSTICYAMASLFNSIFQAHEKMEYQSVGSVMMTLIMLIGTYYAVSQGLSVVAFAFVSLIANFSMLFFGFIVCMALFTLPKVDVNLTFWKATIIEALPFGISGIFMTIYYSVDSVMLSAIQGNEVVGYYAAANRLIQYLVFVPLIVGTTIYPAMAKFHLSSREYLVLLCDKCLKYMIILAIPIAVGTTIIADKIVYSIYGDGFTRSILALQLLIWSMVFVFTSAGYVKLFESINKQRTITKITAIGLAFNVILNLLLIYAFSYIGSSIAAILTQLAMLLILIYISHKLGYETIRRETITTLYKVVIASLAMGLFLWFFKNTNILILVPLAMVIYFGSLYFIRGIGKDDMDLARSILKRA